MIGLRGERELQARLRAISGAKFGRPFMTRVALATVREAKLTVARKTGTTGRTIRMAEVSDDHARVTVGAAGPFLEFGTKAHVIRPRVKKALAFASQKATTERFGAGAKLKFTLAGRLSAASTRKYGNAAYVVVKSVKHPGTRKQPFLVPAARKALRENGLEQAVVEAWNGAA